MICIHGRFQPFHLGHLNYLQNALELDGDLIIGLSTISQGGLGFPGVEHRQTALANPLCYLERMMMIECVMRMARIELERVRFVPFPIDEPRSLLDIIPLSVSCVTTDLYEWNREKIRRLEVLGYKVLTLPGCVKMPFDGSMIRGLAGNGDANWKKLVAPGAVEYLEALRFESRLQSMQAAGDGA